MCKNIAPGSPENCTLWDGLGTTYAFVQTGMFEHEVAGTTLSISKIGSGVPDILNPCIQKFIQTEAYYNACDKWGLTEDCFRNDFFPENVTNATTGYYSIPTNELTTSCSDGYCACPAI